MTDLIQNLKIYRTRKQRKEYWRVFSKKKKKKKKKGKPKKKSWNADADPRFSNGP